MQQTTNLFTAACLAVGLALVTCDPAPADELYMEGSVGWHDEGYDSCQDVSWCDTAPHMGTWMGKFAIGYQWSSGLFVEGEHISGLQDADRGLNAVWFGARLSFFGKE